MKKKLLISIIVATLVGSSIGNAQYVTNFQAVYPYNKGIHATKNFTLARDFLGNGYLLASVSSLPLGSQALAALKVDNDFNIQFSRSFLPVISSKVTSVVTHDVTGTSDGGYVLCGVLSNGNVRQAFIAKFDGKASPEWARIYPEITTLHSVIELILPNESVNDPKYVACGVRSFDTHAYGSVLCVDGNGIPVWESLATGPSRSDKFEYKQIVEYSATLTDRPLLAVVGKGITQPDNNQDVLVTLLDIKGNMVYSHLYGLKNTTGQINDEEGLGIAVLKDKLIVCGRTKSYGVQLPYTLYDDALLFMIDAKSGDFEWAYRYDIPKNNLSGEFAERIAIKDGRIFVGGYYKGYIFNENASYDAFIFETNSSGHPLQVRIFGDRGDDLLFGLMVNNEKDGITAAGFSSSFMPNTPTLPAYAPYIVESYPSVLKNCHDVFLDLPFERTRLPRVAVKNVPTKTRVQKFAFTEVKNPVSSIVVCPKIPNPSLEEKAAQNALSVNDALTPAETNLQVYPSITDDYIYLRGIADNTTISIYSINSQLIMNKTVNIDSPIDVSALTSGVYVIHINDQNPRALKFIRR